MPILSGTDLGPLVWSNGTNGDRAAVLDLQVGCLPVCVHLSIYLYLGVFATHTLYVDYPCLRLSGCAHSHLQPTPASRLHVSVPVLLFMSTRLCSDCVKCLQLRARGHRRGSGRPKKEGGPQRVRGAVGRVCVCVQHFLPPLAENFGLH